MHLVDVRLELVDPVGLDAGVDELDLSGEGGVEVPADLGRIGLVPAASIRSNASG